MATVALSGIITPTNVVTATSTTTLTNKTLTGAVMNGTLGATTPSTVVATTVQASTTMGVGGATPSTSGAGITFPTTQSASTSAKTLDDYEEGTWTPTDGSGASLSFTSVTGNYTKIGNKVTCWTRLTYPSTASTAGAQLNGLPFTVSTTLSASGGGMMAYKTTTSLFSVRANSNGILMQNDTGGQPTNVALTLGTYIFATTYFVD